MFLNLKVISIGILALLVGLYFQLFGFNLISLKNHDQTHSAPDIKGFLWPNQKTISGFSMIDHNGQQVTEEQLAGNWSFVFFGYTHCPDICPITMNTMRQTRDLLHDHPHGKRVQYVFTSVDGERDTPQHLNGYIRFFGENFLGLTGNKSQIDAFTSQIGVPYTIDDHEPGESYLVGHSGAIFLISPENKLAAVLQPPHEAKDLAKRFEQILAFLKS